jgi:thiaminase/transcriptional activator TenA
LTFSQHLRSIAQDVWIAQLSHPFVVALGNGTLPQRKFRYYILQDGRFLAELARVFAVAAKKSPDADSTIRFAQLVEETLAVERSLHENYGKRWKLSPKQMGGVPMAPTNYSYTRHMLHVAESGSALDATVVALPCAWIYCVVGRHLLRKGMPSKSHPYRDWLMLYASPEFAEVGRWMREKVDAWAKLSTSTDRGRLEEAFLISSRYEWMFWEMAWNEEKWPV